MKTHLFCNLKTIALGFSGLLSLVAAPSAIAMGFYAEPVDSDDFAIVASQLPTGGHTLNILEQLESQRQCWLERGSQPTRVDPLLLLFDFARDCKRYDSNGFSVHMANQQFGYQLRVRQSSDDLVLEAFNPFNPKAPVFQVGRADGGVREQHTKIHLDPGWSLNRRQWKGQALGHIEVNFQQVSVNSQLPIRVD